jgi:C-22 sterol desaturase
MSARDPSFSPAIPVSTSHPNSIPFSPIPIKSPSWLATTAVIVVALLVLEQSVYRYKKRHLPGAKWTIPVIGKFADSMSPSMEGYKKQWDSGALSAISVFNM